MNIKDKIAALIGAVAFILIEVIIFGVMFYIAIGVWGGVINLLNKFGLLTMGGVTWLSGN